MLLLTFSSALSPLAARLSSSEPALLCLHMEREEGTIVTARKVFHLPTPASLRKSYRSTGKKHGFTKSQVDTFSSLLGKAYMAIHKVPSKLRNMTHAMHSAFITPSETQAVMGMDKHYPVIWDSGAII